MGILQVSLARAREGVFFQVLLRHHLHEPSEWQRNLVGPLEVPSAACQRVFLERLGVALATRYNGNYVKLVTANIGAVIMHHGEVILRMMRIEGRGCWCISRVSRPQTVWRRTLS